MSPPWHCVNPDSVFGWFASPYSMKRVLTWSHLFIHVLPIPLIVSPSGI